MSKNKELGQIFTPDYIVEKILDNVGYTSENIINKKILEPSFGEGVFLKHIVTRITEECKNANLSLEETKNQLENNIYGIEIDEELYWKTKKMLDDLVSRHGIEEVDWNLYRMDALDFSLNGFDYVVGNPPYVRIHNLDSTKREQLKDFMFAKGTTDLYIIFFELGIKLLNKTGKLGFITPNSWLKNISQKEFRKYLLENNLITQIIDFGSQKVFEKADTYTCLTFLSKNKADNLFAYTKLKDNIPLFSNLYDIATLKGKNSWNLNSPEDERFLADISKRAHKLGTYGTVQYGIATNKDKVYITKDITPAGRGCCYFTGKKKVEYSICQKIVKGSRYKGTSFEYILFPYEQRENGVEIIEESKMIWDYPLAYEYLLKHKEELMKRDMETRTKTWYQFGRSQGLQNMFKKKLVIKHIIPEEAERLEVYELDEETSVYSGIFITAEDDEKLKKIKKVLETPDFCRYAKLCGKDMSGGYKSINTKIIKEYRFD